MMPIHLMQIDALFLLVMCGCALYLMAEDTTVNFAQRAAIGFAGAFAFAQAMWLFGIWVPNAAGYPWPRLSLDAAFMAVAILRVMAVARFNNLHRPHQHRHWRRQHHSMR